MKTGLTFIHERTGQMRYADNAENVQWLQQLSTYIPIQEIKRGQPVSIATDEDLKITIPVDTKQPNNIDIEKIHNEIYEKPENAEYNEQTKELKLDKDGLDFAVSMEEARNILKEKKEEYIIPLKKVKAEITYDKLGKDIFPDLLRNISNKL